jgi:hypothetical protein
MLLSIFVEMLMDVTTYELLLLAGSIVGVYIKLKMDINEVVLKQKNHEIQTEEIKQDLRKLLDAVQEIKLLLARNRLDE